MGEPTPGAQQIFSARSEHAADDATEQPEQTLLRSSPPAVSAEPTAPASTLHPPRVPVPHKPIAIQIPGYEIVDELGRGGMGVVYKARQVRLDRTVALKMILAGSHAGREALARFYAEAAAVAGLQHPNVVQIHEVGEQEGQPYFSMEFVDGPSLDRKLAATPQPIRPAVQLIETLARAVHAAHQKGIVHRDLKPANVLLAPVPPGESATADLSAERYYGIPKITDFGLAKRAGEESGQTRTGDVLGTPTYMAPEQAAGRTREIGPPADVYALGTILYELLTGRPPFTGATALETITRVIDEDPVPPGRHRPGLPRDLETICLKCLEKAAYKRYGSALELADDCAAFLRGEPLKARPRGRVERLWRWCRRNPLAASLLIAVTMGALLGLWHLSRLSEELVRSAALESAAQQSQTLEELNRYYSDVVENIKPIANIQVTHDWTKTKGHVPIPATLTIELGQRLRASNPAGVVVRLYSDYPFRSRKDGNPQDDFEWTALKELRGAPTTPFYRFEEYNGRPALRYATARVMTKSCIKCHNSHPDRPIRDKDWEVGEVRGVLEIIRPLDKDAARVEHGLRGTVILVLGVGCGLLVVCGLAVVIGKRRQRRPSVDLGLGNSRAWDARGPAV